MRCISRKERQRVEVYEDGAGLRGGEGTVAFEDAEGGGKEARCRLSKVSRAAQETAMRLVTV